MRFELVFTEHANDQMEELETSSDMKSACKAVRKILGFMEANLKHPSLNTHKYKGMTGPNKEDIFESYAQNNTPGAYRVFWHYGPEKRQITILEICPHP